jgi:hypothetical protein
MGVYLNSNMASYEDTPLDEELTHSEQLRDRILDWVPLNARLLGVFFRGKIEYGDKVISIVFNPNDGTVDLDYDEPVYASLEAEKEDISDGLIRTGLDIDIADGAVNAFSKTMVPKVAGTTEFDEAFLLTVDARSVHHILTPAAETLLLRALDLTAVQEEITRYRALGE